MYNFLISNPVLAIILLVIAFFIAIFVLVKVMQTMGLEKVRSVVYKEILNAEKKYAHGENTRKFEHVVYLARSAIPSPLDIFITETTVRKFVQLCFNLVKDYLDDGKLNGIGRNGE